MRIWSPKDTGYFEGLPAMVEMLVFGGILACDLFNQAMLDVRPSERERGATEKLSRAAVRELVELIESAASRKLSVGAALANVLSGRLFGIAGLLKRYDAQFSALRGAGELPVVELAGEIYVRTVGFSNDFLIEKLEERGLRVFLAPKSEWIAYCGDVASTRRERHRISQSFTNQVRHQIERAAVAAFGQARAWWPAPSSFELLAAAEPYVDRALYGEAVLTVGSPLHEWRRGKIDGLVNVGPLECMPTKISEAQLQVVAEREGLPSLTLAFNGEPVSLTALDDFAFEVKNRFHQGNCRKQQRQEQSA